MVTAGAVRAIALPFGNTAPPCHMHADDTTIHAASPADCDMIIEGPVAAFAAASGAQLNPTKTKEVRVQHAGLFAGSADLRSFLAQESSQVAAFVSAGFDAVLGD